MSVSAMMLPVNIHELLGMGLRAARLNQGWRQQDASNKFRAAGLFTWTPLAVGQVENGVRKPSIGDYLLACTALGVSLADLIADDVTELVDLGTGATMKPAAVKAILSGTKPSDIEETDITIPGDLWIEVALGRNADLESQLLPIWASARVPLGEDDFQSPLIPATEAEQRAAERLGIVPAQLKAASRVLWQRDFEVERDDRVDASEVPASTLQARRGHATRAMLAQLRDYLVAIGLVDASSSDDREAGRG